MAKIKEEGITTTCSTVEKSNRGLVSRQALELLLPTVQYGNVKLISDLTMSTSDSTQDGKELLIECRKVALRELLLQKQEIEAALEKADFSLNLS